jgi:NAD(P)-dependent dehydrogenase (short-subunit alcohol dehydrogenase family)
VALNVQTVGELSGQTFVITGANSGVGLEAAKVLAAAGANIVMACRDLQRAATARDTHPRRQSCRQGYDGRAGPRRLGHSRAVRRGAA